MSGYKIERHELCDFRLKEERRTTSNSVLTSGLSPLFYSFSSNTDNFAFLGVSELYAVFARVRIVHRIASQYTLGGKVKEESGDTRNEGEWLANNKWYRVMKEARIQAKQSGERGVTAKSVRKVREGCLRKFKG